MERAAIRFDVETTYTRALAAAAHARLSRRTAQDADSLLTMARLRREVGDVSELDVRLAAVNAGQLENAAGGDPLPAGGAGLAGPPALGPPGGGRAIAPAHPPRPPTRRLPGPPGGAPSPGPAGRAA